jgi:hypothetical protein
MSRGPVNSGLFNWGLSVLGPEVGCSGGTVANSLQNINRATKAITTNKNDRRDHLPYIYSTTDMLKLLKKRDIHTIQIPLNKVVHQ